jgi:predicted  nucleic acid-binding Zn-ribbon protein
VSLSLEDLKGELRENYSRIEEVLSGMDNYIIRLENRLAAQDERIEVLEGQLASLVAALIELAPEI